MSSTSKPPPTLSAEEQKRYLKRNIGAVAVEFRSYMAQLIIDEGLRNDLKDCAEGMVINLDAMREDVLLLMYEVLFYERQRLARGYRD